VSSRSNTAAVGIACKVVVDSPVAAIAFGDLGVSDDKLRRLLAAKLDRKREIADERHSILKTARDRIAEELMESGSVAVKYVAVKR
jgi:hypothetical protein